MTFTLPDDANQLTRDDLRRLTDALIDEVQRLLRRCRDADVTFLPVDPLANDAGAATEEEARMPWTLAHILVHMTASSEEQAVLAAELARGVAYHGRSRSEVPWQQIATLAQCRARLEESRRMRCASLDMWPDGPHLENTSELWPGGPVAGPVQRFIAGLGHDAAHLPHLRDVVTQARDYRYQRTLLARLRRGLRPTEGPLTNTTAAGLA
jgi:hypothetical protein